MNRLQHVSRNATLNSVEYMDGIGTNIMGLSHNGRRMKRFSFSDYVHGGQIESGGYHMGQGKLEPRVGEWSKVMIKGRGFFALRNPENNQEVYTRLGDFHINAQGDLVNPFGMPVQGLPLAGALTHLKGPDPKNPSFNQVNPNFVDPFNNPYTNNAQPINAPGPALGSAQDINLGINPRNGKYLGFYDEIKIGKDGVVYGKAANNLVSLYKLHVVAFNNPSGLRNVKDDTYFAASAESGMPSMGVSSNIVISEALERANGWVKTEAHNLTDAQRYFQAATQIHKLADKISGTAIEMIQ